MQWALNPSLLHLYFISHVSHCINSCGLFLPSADNYFSLLGFVIKACFPLATLSIDNILQILDRCRGVGSGDTVRRIITALFSPVEINKHVPYQHHVQLASQRCVLHFTSSEQPIMMYVTYQEPQCPFSPPTSPLVYNISPSIPSHLLTTSFFSDLFTFTLPCFTYFLSLVWLRFHSTV